MCSFNKNGFTIVELLIVIVVIAVLAAISVVAYNGVQTRARDTDRRSDLATIIKALELYYVDNGTYPSSTSTSTKINSSWVTTSDSSWPVLEAQLVPKYLSVVPKDPLASSATNPAIYAGYSFDYLKLENGWCNTSTSKPGYLLAYRFENSGQEFKINGNCPTGSTQPTDYSSSEYINVK